MKSNSVAKLLLTIAACTCVINWMVSYQTAQPGVYDPGRLRLRFDRIQRLSAEWQGFIERGDLNRDGLHDRFQPMVQGRSINGVNVGLVPAYQPR